MDLKIRPIHHRLDDRIRAHVFLCMLAYYLEWHLRQKLRPILFDDHQQEEAQRDRESIVQPAPRSQEARDKDARKTSAEGWPVHSFQTMLNDLATLARNFVRVPGTQSSELLPITTNPTEYQKHVLELAGVSAQ